jgi:hypothetical protein
MEWLKQRYRRWRATHPRTADEFLATVRTAENGQQILLYEGDGDSWFPHPHGVGIVKGQDLYLNGRERLHENKGPGMTYQRHPDGFMVVNSNGRRVVLNGTGDSFCYSSTVDECVGHPRGYLVRSGRQFLLNGMAKLYYGPYDGWGVHANGVIIRHGNRLCLNGERLLYDLGGDWAQWSSHPHGFVVAKSDGSLHFNGRELMVACPYDDWSPHDHGVLIRQHKRFSLIVHKAFDADRIIV